MSSRLFLVCNGVEPEGLPRAMARWLPQGMSLHVVSTTNRPLPRTIEGRAARVVDQIRHAQPQGPYCLFGSGIEGLVAYEAAYYLAGEDELVEFVGVAEPQQVSIRSGRGGTATGTQMSRSLWEYAPQPIHIPVSVFVGGDLVRGVADLGWLAALGPDAVRQHHVNGTGRAALELVQGEAFSAQLAAALSAGETDRETQRSYDPLITLQFGNPGVDPVFGVPGAGASVVSLLPLSRCFDAGRPVHGLQPRGLDGERIPHASVTAAASTYLPVICEAEAALPVHLVGHSFGGWVVFELAGRLRDAGREVASVTLIDTAAPTDPTGVPEYDALEAFAGYVEIFEQRAERRISLAPEEIAVRDTSGRLELLHRQLGQMGLVPPRSSPDLLTGPFRTYGVALRAAYTPSSPYDGAVTLIQVRDPRRDHATNTRNLAATEQGWKEWAPNVRAFVATGNHMTVLDEPHVQDLARRLPFD